MGKPPGHIVLSIVAALEEHEELTRPELARITGLARSLVSPVVSRMHRMKRVHIARYVRQDDASMRSYPRAVYALGDKPDARYIGPEPRPVITKRSRDNTAKRVNSVWQLGLSRRARRGSASARA